LRQSIERVAGLEEWRLVTVPGVEDRAQPIEMYWGRGAQTNRRRAIKRPVVRTHVGAASNGTGDTGQDPAVTSHPNEVAVADDLAVAAPQRIGWFRFYFDDQRWEWSEELQKLHGYQPGTVTPTTELVLSHKHPEDRDEVAANIVDITNTRGAFRSRHRVIDAVGVVRWVVVIGDQFFDDAGAVVGTHGFYVDVTPANQLREEAISARVIEIAELRAPIEHVKGMLMLIYNIDDTVAFGLLKWLSQEHNVKLGPLAKQIRTDLRAVAQNEIVSKTTFDHMLLTAHERLGSAGEYRH
jgi:hypothetical protein